MEISTIENKSENKNENESEITKKINKAKELKELGNFFFKEQKYSKAKSKYGMALAYITGFPGNKRSQTGWESLAYQSSKDCLATDEEEIEATNLEVILQQNLSTCYIKLNDPKTAMIHCNKALHLNPNSWKAMLRKGEIYLMKESFDEAESILQSALNHTSEPANLQSIRALLKKKEILEKKYEAKERNRYKALFRAKESDNTELQEETKNNSNEKSNEN